MTLTELLDAQHEAATLRRACRAVSVELDAHRTACLRLDEEIEALMAQKSALVEGHRARITVLVDRRDMAEGARKGRAGHPVPIRVIQVDAGKPSWHDAPVKPERNASVAALPRERPQFPDRR